MRIIIDIPEQFESDYKGDMFKDFFSRVLCDIPKGTICDNYEKETAEMFLKAFDESILMEKQKECEDCAGCTAWKCDCSNVRNKAIDDFVTKLKEETFNGYVTLEDYFEDSIECVAVEDIDSIAEQLKEGGVE